MHIFTIEKDGTTYDKNGNALFFSFEFFEKNICKKGYCFICGTKPNKNFNKEHVIPNWLQKKTNIQREKLTLPNGNLTTYATYKISCCEKCNTTMGRIYEAPISDIFSKGYNSLIEDIENNSPRLLCSWLSLIFLKVHLRDFKNKKNLDNRFNDGNIGETYNLHELHNIHAIARATIHDIDVDPRAFGSLIVLPADKTASFDYCDNLAGRTLMIRIKDIAIIYVIDDCGATIGMLEKQLKFIPDILSEIQLREIYTRYYVANMHIKSIPEFKTDLIHARITVDLPETLEFKDFTPHVFGEELANTLINYKNNINVKGKVGEEAINLIRNGDISFLT